MGMGDATLQEIDTGASACSVEWCPITGLEGYVACSTYLLASDAVSQDTDLPVNGVAAAAAAAAAIEGQSRSGTVVVHKLASNPSTSPPALAVEDDAPASSSNARLEEAARVPSLDGGVLDAKWSPQPLTESRDAAVLACATSTGCLVLYTLSVPGSGKEEEEQDGEQQSAELLQLSSSDNDDSLLLSLDWSGGSLANAKIVVSQSNGALAVWRMHPNGGAPIREVAPWHAHTLRGGVPTEAWISFFRRSRGTEENGASFVVSGADDALMKGWDLRAGGGACGASPAFVCKGHGAGVTAGQWHPTLEHIFVSGSYDESVRVWDARNTREPVSTTPTGGGVWRLKWHPNADRGNILLAACMHAGVCVLNTGTGVNHSQEQAPYYNMAGGGLGLAGPNEMVATYTRHASMAYGADWCRVPTLLRNGRAVVASCSFYDNLLCLWQTPQLWAE